MGEGYQYYFRVAIWRRDHPEITISADIEDTIHYALFGELQDDTEDWKRTMGGLAPQVRAHIAGLKTSFSSPSDEESPVPYLR